MEKLLKSNLWILSAVLYPLSWVTYSGPNLSFIAWFAFVPLLIYQYQHQRSFIKFYGSALAVIAFWGATTSFWLFNFPIPVWQTSIGFIIEILHLSFPFLLFYFAQKLICFEKALCLFPLIWVAWEWIYIPLQHTLGTLSLAYSQGNNIWLIQMADIGGMWLISFWIMLFNVLIYFTLKKFNFTFRTRAFALSFSKLFALMIVPPLMYCVFSFQKNRLNNEGSLKISIIPTQFEPEYLMNLDNQQNIIESTLHRTDSLAYELTKANNGSDLYVWPEAGTSYWMAFDNLTSILHEATSDWSGSLLTGCQGVPVEGHDKNAYVSGVMISPTKNSSSVPLQYHHKTALVPGTEAIPYEEILLPFFSKHDSTLRRTSQGKSFDPLKLVTNENEQAMAGVSLCYEQWFPSVWTKQVENGAQFFVHMAAEGWYGDFGYAQYMANVSRFRAVETRRAVVRSSNVGLSMFINAHGDTYNDIAYGSLNMATALVETSTEMTLFSKFPNAFPRFCLFISLLGFIGIMIFQDSSSQKTDPLA